MDLLPLQGVVDLEQECARLRKELQEVEAERRKSQAKLDNEQFMRRAPQEIVAKEQRKEEECRRKQEKLRLRLEEMEKLCP